MRISADFLYEIDRLRNNNIKWKLAVLLVGALMIFFAFGSSNEVVTGQYIARVNIDGELKDDLDMLLTLGNIIQDKNIAGVVLHINSPGGSPYFSEEVYRSFRKVSEKGKPVVVVMGSVAASGGYMIALAGDNIFAGETTVTGSIGAVMETIDASELSQKIGVKVKTYKYPPLKGEPSLTDKISPGGENALQSVAIDIYEVFVGMVAERRKLSKDYLVKIADGRIYTGRQALKLKLIDKIGGEDEAVEWLYHEKKLPRMLKVKDYKIIKGSFFSREIFEPIAGIYSLYSSIINNGFMGQFN